MISGFKQAILVFAPFLTDDDPYGRHDVHSSETRKFLMVYQLLNVYTKVYTNVAGKCTIIVIWINLGFYPDMLVL